jgi:formylglycine-generating enzyme required for sulfatase activity/class 3 adenylate cyclase
MEETDIKRKLATILVADIVGYSRLTANDEDWTIRALGDFRKVIDDIIARHDGRIFSTGGDSVLAEFASPVEAVRAAVDFQEASRSRNLLQPRDRQLRYRIGINLGDVMVRGSDLLGDGVNVAARLEGIAEPGGICVSASVWEHINGKLSIGYVDIGEQSVKNIPRPVRAYHLRVDGSIGEAADTVAKRVPETASARSADGRQRMPIAAMLAAALGTALLIAIGGAAWQFWPKGHPSPGPTAAARPAKRASQAPDAVPQAPAAAPEAPAAAPQASAAEKPIVIPPASLPQPAPAPTPSTTTAQSPASAPQPAPAPSPQPAATASAPAKTFRDCPNCPEMVVIPAGSFQMGAAPGENQRYQVPTTESGRDEPQHQVTFAKPFALGKFDITRAEFAAFVQATNFRPRRGCMTSGHGAWEPQEQATWQEPGFAQTDRDPVVCMNMIEIGNYLTWLRRTTGKEYRLPSEAEWEYAARGGTTTTFYWGDDVEQACSYENLADATYKAKYGGGAVECIDHYPETAPVGSFKPNPFGLYDMSGNVFVLTADCWNESYAGAPSDGSAWKAGDCERHPARGASFGVTRVRAVRVANRFPEIRIAKRNRFGFRVALSLP